jgi:hypothetical protein
MTAATPSPFGSGVVLFGLFASVTSGLFLWAWAEMIDVVIDIEENTRRAASPIMD